MGGRYPPGSASRPNGGPLRSDDPAFDPTGRGAYDAETGLWDWYEDPDEDDDGVSFQELIRIVVDDWHLVVADFATQYSIRLHRELAGMTWGEFFDLLVGLITADTRVWRTHFRHDDDPKGGDPE
jgi:hypothetical protein